MSSESLARQVVRTVGESPVAERVATAQERSALDADALGHSVHPMLTGVTVGCWLSASLLDVVGGCESRAGARLLVGLGLLASAPTAVAGAVDRAGTSGTEQRIGAVHALGTDLGSFLLLASFVARVRGRHATGTRLALAGNAAIAGAGFLGGRLALDRGTARSGKLTRSG